MLSENKQSFGIKDHLNIFFRYKRKILIVLLVAVIVTGPGSFTLSEVYQAKSRILIQQNRVPIKIGAALTQSQASTIDSSQNGIKTQIEVFKSPILVERLVQRLGAQNILDSMRWRWDWLTGAPAKALDWFKGLLGPKKQAPLEWFAAQKIVKHLEIKPVVKTDVFEVYFYAPDPQFAAKVLNIMVELYLEHHASLLHGKGAKDFFNQEVENAVREVKEAQKNLLEFKKKYGVVQIAAQQRILLDKISEVKSKYNAAQLKIVEVRKRINVIEKQLAGKSHFTMDQSQYQRLQAALSLEKRNLEGLYASNKYKQDIENYRQALNNLNEKEGEYNNLIREVKLKEEALALYQKKQEETRINIKLDSRKISNITPIEMASVPINPIKPQKKRNLILGIVIGLLGGIVLAYGLNFFRRTLISSDELERKFTRPVFATVPIDNEDADTKAEINLQMQSLREQLLQIKQQKNVKTILLTSALSGEGKSFISQLLAEALALSGHRTLVVQNLVTEELACKVLNQDMPVPQPTHTTNPHIDVLTCKNKFQLNAEIMQQIEHHHRDKYDFIIVSGATVSSESNVLSIASTVDSILVVVESELTPEASVAKIIKLLEKAGGSIAGFVLNKRKRYIPQWLLNRNFST